MHERSRLSDTGELTDDSTPWARQFMDDTAALGEHEDYREWVANYGTNVHDIFDKNKGGGLQFDDFDFGVLRAAVWSKKVPPPGWLNHEQGDSSSDNNVDLPWMCGYVCEETDEVCDKHFKDRRAALAHFRKAH